MQIGVQRASRGLLIGKTGSGKSRLALELVQSMPKPVLIIDTKYARSILAEAEKQGWEIVEEIPPEFEGVIVWRPPAEMLADPYLIDGELAAMVQSHAVCSIYIDELYQVHKNGRAGPGIIGLWTRGREMGFTTLAATQRPAWISTFCITESDQFYIFTLTNKDDRKKMAEGLAAPELVENVLEKYWFWYVEQGEDAVLCRPYDFSKKELTEGQQVGIDSANAVFVPLQGAALQGAAPKLIK